MAKRDSELKDVERSQKLEDMLVLKGKNYRSDLLGSKFNLTE